MLVKKLKNKEIAKTLSMGLIVIDRGEIGKVKGARHFPVVSRPQQMEVKILFFCYTKQKNDYSSFLS